MKAISASTHLKLSAQPVKRGKDTFTRFTKPFEPQDEAIKRLMRSVKSAQRKAEARRFPNSTEALKSTHAYVVAYYHMNGLSNTLSSPLADLFTLNKNPTTWPEGPEVVVEDDPDYCDLV